jgi:hypothetical protein
MLNGLSAYITSVKAENQALIPNNPQNRTYIDSKIAALSSPTLFADIINGRRWQEGVAASTVGPAVPISTVFMLEPMRAEAADTIRTITQAGPFASGTDSRSATAAVGASSTRKIAPPT